VAEHLGCSCVELQCLLSGIVRNSLQDYVDCWISQLIHQSCTCDIVSCRNIHCCVVYSLHLHTHIEFSAKILCIRLPFSLVVFVIVLLTHQVPLGADQVRLAMLYRSRLPLVCQSLSKSHVRTSGVLVFYSLSSLTAIVFRVLFGVLGRTRRFVPSLLFSLGIIPLLSFLHILMGGLICRFQFPDSDISRSQFPVHHACCRVRV
jgi:hypothetical protein